MAMHIDIEEKWDLPSFMQKYAWCFLNLHDHCYVGKMKVKEVNRTANIAWSPAPQYPIYLAAGTAAQQLDATFR